MKRVLFSLLLLLAAAPAFAASQPEQFTYQGHLDLNGQSANGTYLMTFTLFDAATGGSQVGTSIHSIVPVSDGTFAVLLSYPGAFTGTQLWLEITVNSQSIGARQVVAAAPVAQFSLNGGRMLDFNDSVPSTDPNSLATLLNTVGPFKIIANCRIDSATQNVTTALGVNSDDHYSFRIASESQIDDAGAITPAVSSDIGQTAGLLKQFTATAGHYKRAWVHNLTVHSLESDQTLTISGYIGADARAGSTSCVIEGTATLGL